MKKYVIRKNRYSIFTDDEISLLEDERRISAVCAGVLSALKLIEQHLGDAHEITLDLRDVYQSHLRTREYYQSQITDEIKNKVLFNSTEYVKRIARNRKIRNRNVI